MANIESLAAVDWARVEQDLAGQGWANCGPILSADERSQLVSSYDENSLFRSKVVMARHGFGRGEYQYFRYPLPPLVSDLRAQLYERLVPIANGWRSMLGEPSLPTTLREFIAHCHAAGQERPTPLMLRYGPGDYNCLHQDLYGDLAFPLQVAILLSEPGGNFTGGEFVLTEQRPRMQSRVHVVPLQAGEAVVFAVNQRPVRGARGPYRVAMRHGVSPVRTGHRHTLGIIFHDAA